MDGWKNGAREREAFIDGERDGEMEEERLKEKKGRMNE